MSTTATAGAVTEGLGFLEGQGRPLGRKPVPPSVTLTTLEEPVEVLAELRALLAPEPAAARSAAPGLLAAHAVAIWSDQLKGLGIRPEVVTHAFETLRREIWLWLEGDRRWDQLAGHLGARVVRRASLSATERAAPPSDRFFGAASPAGGVD
ncbi:MAG TPA: hypothetical protein VEH29_10820 [Acidimicrobiales bacterium]|nr:hypothetical protein [Acidimicrobiales bacterium]